MNNTKLILLLKSLSNSEFKQFMLYCQSPYFNKNITSNHLLKNLERLHPEYSESKLKRELFFNLLFQNEKYNYLKLRRTFSNLTILLESFLSQKAYEGDVFENKNSLLKKLLEKKKNKIFLQHLKNTERELEHSDNRNSAYYTNEYSLKKLSYQHSSIYSNRSLDRDLQGLVDTLDINYLTQKLKYACEMLNRKNILRVEYKFHFIAEILNAVEKTDFITIPAINIYYQIIKILLNPADESIYMKAKIIVNNSIKLFPKAELNEIYTLLQNYCIHLLNSGSGKYLQEAFDNYETMLGNKIIIEEGTISNSNFKNIVTIALRLKQFTWTEKFISTYSKILDVEFKKDAVTYNLSRLYYSQKKYKEALRLMQQVDFIDVYYQLDAKTLLLKIYYDTNAEEPMFSLLSSFKIFLKRNKEISEYQYLIYNNFIKYLRRLYKIKTGGKGMLSDIEKSIRTHKDVADTQWMLEKIAENSLS